MKASIATEQRSRAHSIYALNLLNVYLLLIEGEMLPGYQQPGFLQRISIRLLLNKFDFGKPDTYPELDNEELKVMYACYTLGNRLIGTSRGDFLCGLVIQQIPAGDELKDPVAFRAFMLEHNAAGILDIEMNQAASIPDFQLWRMMVTDFVIS